MRKLFSLTVLCTFFTTIFSQSWEPSMAYVTNFYNKSNPPNTSSNIVTGAGHAVGFRLMDLWQNRFGSLGFGFFYQKYSGGFYSEVRESKLGASWEQADVKRTIVSGQFYPLTVKFFKKKLSLSAGLEFDMLIRNQTAGKASYLNSENGQYNRQTFEYMTDTFGYNRKTTTGLLFSAAIEVFELGAWAVKPRYTIFYGIDPDFDTYSRIYSLRNMFELTMSAPLWTRDE